MRRGERLKLPKFVISNYRTSISDFKKYLKEVFYVLSDSTLNASRDIRIWIIDDEKVHSDEFIESYNQGISNNMMHSFDFPGKII